jgi:hypothetical protein
MRNESRRSGLLLFVLLIAAAVVDARGESAADARGESAGELGGQAAGEAPGAEGVEAAFPALRSALPAEAPSSVFNAKLGNGPDADAELFVSGSWSSTLIGSIDMQAEPGSSLAMSSAQPLLYTQEPDIALSFLLYKRIFVEAKVSQDIAQAKYAAGYRGGEGELLREFRVGNDGINFPVLPYLSFGDGSYRSFGASALIGTDTFAGKAMVRYDQASRVTKRFVGSTEVTEAVLTPNSFITGKYFMTLYAPATDLAIYVESSSGNLSGGDGKKYRRLESSEYSYSAVTGVVSLSAVAATRVLARYSASGSPTDPVSGAAMEVVTINGVGSCDLLYDPPSSEHESPTLNPKLQILSRYSTTATASTGEAFVRNASSGLRDTYYQAEIREDGYVEVTKLGNEVRSGMSAAERQAFRQPFGDSKADMTWIYTTDFASDTRTIGIAPVYTRDVVVRTFASASKITIDKDFVAGSVEVTRNGVPDYAFTVDADSGVLSLASPPAASEEIVITYLKESEERKTGIIVGALGGFWDLGSGKSAWAALGASWSLPGSSYSSGEDSSPGSVNLTAGGKETEGVLKYDAAVAGRYSRDDSTGIYRVEGMESTSDYATSFRLLSGSSGYRDEEIVEKDLDSEFPSLIDSFHRDGSSQKALRIVSDGSPSPAAFYKVETAPAYPSYKTFAFFAKLPPGASLTLKLDDGSSTTPAELGGASVGVVVPADATRSGDWDRYILHYGKGDSSVYVQDDEGSSQRLLPGASSESPSIKSTGSRLVVAVTGLAKNEEAWIDEIVLEDSAGRGAFLFQGNLHYDDPELMLGREESPLVSRVKAAAYAQGAVDSDPYASGGGSLAAALGFVGLGLRARTVVTDRSASFSGGHSIELPTTSFPARIKDDFDYDPSSGAFGRTDSVELRCWSLASLNAKQTSAWTPDASFAESGILVQDWDGNLVLGPSLATFGLTAKNRSLPARSPSAAEAGNDYTEAWVGAFAYALPAFEGDSDLREAKATLSVKGPPGEYLAASLGETTTPGESGSGLRGDSASVRMALPFAAFGLSLEPYYSRRWKDQRNESGDSLVADADAALGDIAGLPVFYASVPFKEFFSSSTASDFADQTRSGGAALPAANYLPELGIKMSRETGSSPIDLVAPEAVALSYGRSLSREEDTVTDASVWTTSAKCAAVNVFGSLGTTPLGLPFDSDEYLSTIQADLTKPRDGSASSYDILYHGLSTFYAGNAQADRLDAESRFSMAVLPSSLNWSGSLSLSLSRRVERHWLLSIYNRAVKPLPAKPESLEPSLQTGTPSGEGTEEEAAITSLYVSDLRSREPIMRSTWTLAGGLSGLRSDADAYQPGWSLAESYEAKLTVPERLTIKVTTAFNQSVDDSTRIFTLGFLLSLNAVISF